MKKSVLLVMIASALFSSEPNVNLLGDKVNSIQVINFEALAKEKITDKITRQWVHGKEG